MFHWLITEQKTTSLSAVLSTYEQLVDKRHFQLLEVNICKAIRHLFHLLFSFFFSPSSFAFSIVIKIKGRTLPGVCMCMYL